MGKSRFSRLKILLGSVWLAASLHCFSAYLPESVPEETPLEKALGWHNLPDYWGNICGGHYEDEPSHFPEKLDPKATYLKADKIILSKKKPSYYEGNVLLAQPSQEMTAEKATTFVDIKRSKLKAVEAEGAVTFRQSGLLTISKKGEFDFEKETGSFYESIYRLLHTPKSPLASALHTSSAHGEAAEIHQVKPHQYELNQATYTTCAPSDDSWYLKTDHLALDTLQKKIRAKNVVFYLEGVAVLYTPFLEYSYDGQPHSGLLSPVLGHSSKAGLYLGLPFYLYSASNVAGYITPFLYEKRGIGLNTEIDYLTWNSSGQFNFSVLPHDKLFSAFKKEAPIDFSGNPGLERLAHDSTTRNLIAWKQTTLFNPFWSGSVDLNHVSDDYYFQDFDLSSSNNLSNQLVQKGSLHYLGEHWDFSALVQNYQTLHPVNTLSSADQYARLPEINLNASYPLFFKDLSYENTFQWVNFHLPLLPDHYFNTTTLPVVGQRFDLHPKLDLTKKWTWGYVKPSVQLEGSFYQLDSVHNHTLSQLFRSVPLLNLDSALFLERDVRYGNQDYLQTFEPRFFYLLVPTIKQDKIPVFDTADTFFNYNSLFQTNRFSGIDKISNANQLGVGFSSHLIDPISGADHLNASLGELFYFTDRQVPLTVSSPNDKKPFSPITGEINYLFNPATTVSGGAAWNPNYKFFQNGNLNLNYRFDPRHIFNLGLSYERLDALDPANMPANNNNNIKQLLASTYWPLSPRLSALGALTYNLNNRYLQNYLAGLEYNTCCWALRVVASHNLLYLDQRANGVYDTNYYLQWTFKGLTELAFNEPGRFLSGQIPGFVDTLKSS